MKGNGRAISIKTDPYDWGDEEGMRTASDEVSRPSLGPNPRAVAVYGSYLQGYDISPSVPFPEGFRLTPS